VMPPKPPSRFGPDAILERCPRCCDEVPSLIELSSFPGLVGRTCATCALARVEEWTMGVSFPPDTWPIDEATNRSLEQFDERST